MEKKMERQIWYVFVALGLTGAFLSITKNIKIILECGYEPYSVFSLNKLK